MRARERLVLGLLLFLMSASAAVLVLDPGISSRGWAAAEEFQTLVGGLGFGPALDLSGCAFGFDPRLEGSCSAAVGPLPGGACFCGRHGGPQAYPPLRQRGIPAALEGDDALPP